MPTLLDSNIVIDALKGLAPALDEIGSLDETPAISVVTRIEVLAGCPDADALAFARALLSEFVVLGLAPAVEEQTIEVRRTTRLKLPDAIILATARVHGLTLSTRNTKDFSESDPTIRVPYQL